VAELHDGHLHVRRLPLVALGEPAAQAPNFRGQRGPGDGPAGDVDLVDALVADVTDAEVPEPVPVVMDQAGVVRLIRSRPAPQIEVQLARRLGDRLVADTPARLAAV